MKKLSIILAIIILIALFPSCNADDSKPDFEFSYELEKTEYLRGEEIEIKASLKNISGRKLKYTGCSGNDYIPMAELYCLNSEGEYCGKLICVPPELPANVIEKTIKRGEVGSYTYVVKIPADAVCGEYTLKLWRGDDSQVFENILRINAVTSQNENDEYRYSPITVSAGGDMINPIRTVSGFYVQNADGSSALGCDGMGVWNYFGKDNTDISTFPTLIREGSIGIDIPEYTELHGVGIFDLNFERINGYTLTSIEDINYLPAGEYFIVLSVRYDTSVRDPNEFEQYDYEDFFRLSVPAKSVSSEKKYTYSHVLIRSGGFEIRPVQCMLWVEEHKNGECLTGDGFGVSQIVENKEDHSNFPTIVYKNDLEVLPPVNAYISRIVIYDTDYNKLDYSFESLHNIRGLLPGEYLVVFYEELDGRGCNPDITEYTIRANECIFKFIVPENTVRSFSFSTICEIYKSGDPGVKTKGFKNTSNQAVATTAEASERAKNECTIGYDTITAQYDADEKVWSITFSTRGTLGGCQTVYLNDKGITLLIVYGE